MLEKIRRIINPTKPNLRSDSDGIMGDWQAVGNDLRSALNQVASEIGGEEFASNVQLLSGEPLQLLPNPNAFRYLEANYPGFVQVVMDRSDIIQQERFVQEKKHPKI